MIAPKIALADPGVGFMIWHHTFKMVAMTSHRKLLPSG